MRYLLVLALLLGACKTHPVSETEPVKAALADVKSGLDGMDASTSRAEKKLSEAKSLAERLDDLLKEMEDEK